MTALSFITIELVPSAAVATSDTMVFTYGGSYNAASFKQSGERLIISGLGNDLDQAAGTFTLSYGASSVTVTYTDATSIPAGTKVTLQLPLATYADLVDLTDNSGGTAADTIAAIGATYDQAEVRNAVASMAAKINSLNALVNQLKSDLAGQNIVPD